MPHGKRTREVSLTQAKKQTRQDKENLVDEVRGMANQFDNIFVLYYSNESTKALMALREQVKGARFSFASNAVLQLAVGRDEATALFPRSNLLGKLIRGKCALMFTAMDASQVAEALQGASQIAYLQGGQIASQTIEIPQGPLNKAMYAGPMEPEFRRLGLPTKLDNEVIVVTEPYTVCRAGQPINGAQASLLRHFGHQLAEFKIEAVACWLKADQDILLLKDSLAELLD